MDNTIPQDDTPRKFCPKCKQWKPSTTDFFARDRNRTSGLQVYCKVCLRRRDPSFYEKIPEGHKRCGHCKQILPASPAYFNRNSHNKDGLSYQCKKCIGNGTTFGEIPEPKEYREDEKQCSRCKQWLPKSLDFFFHDKITKDGFGSQCRKCSNESKKERYAMMDEAKKEEKRQQSRQYYEANKEDVCRTNREYYANHKEEVYQYKKRYRQEHYEELHQPEVIAKRNQYIEEWRSRPEVQPRYRELDRAHQHTRRARKKGLPGTHTHEQVREQYDRQKGKCYYCRKKVKWGEHHADHVIPLSRDGSNGIENIVITCSHCNLEKHSKLPSEYWQGNRLM